MFPQTPSQTVGPFFHYGLLFDGENNLVTEQTRGDRILIRGRVLDGDGQPVPDALIEIWQADAQGYFNHPVDPNHDKADKNFRGFGRADTTDQGRFLFKTVKPGRVPNQHGQLQAPHVNARVFARGMLIHALTRLYFSDEESNADDPTLNLIEDRQRRQTLIAAREETNDLSTYRFDIHLQGEGETVFFEP